MMIIIIACHLPTSPEIDRGAVFARVCRLGRERSISRSLEGSGEPLVFSDSLPPDSGSGSCAEDA